MGVTDRRIVHVVRDPNPAAVRFAAGLAAVYGRNINGHTNSVHIGEKFSRSRRFSGYLGALQTFRGAAWFSPTEGVIRSPKVYPSKGLPNTQAPLADSSPILAGLRNGLRFRGGGLIG